MKGGKRKGAGRPVLPAGEKKRAISVFLPPALIDWMRKNRALLGSRAKIIEMAVREKYSL